MTGLISADVVVCGAGTAGVQAALQLARVGFDVVVLDERSAGKSGARWCNGVLAWQFERAGLEPPAPPALRGPRGRIHMSSPSGRTRFTIEQSPVLDVDMRLLGEQLRSAADAQGVRFMWRAREASVELDGGRPVALRVEVGGEPQRVEASLFVDATGLRAALRHQVPASDSVCPDVEPSESCSARQMIYRVESAAGAARFLEREGARPGDAIDRVGLSGGYSVEVISIEPDLSEVSVLVGTLGDGTHGDASDMTARLRAEHDWIGTPVFGGGGTIPLRRPYARLGVPGLVLVGDAACQVMATHGSGVGFGLMAGKVLAEAVAGSADPGSLQSTWGYQSLYHREFGAILIGYDVFRRYSSGVGSSGVEALFSSGLFDDRLAAPGLEQRMGTVPAADLPDRIRALASHPSVARSLIPALARMQLARILAPMYPATPRDSRLAAWDRAVARVVG